jgi:CoA transferase family III
MTTRPQANSPISKLLAEILGAGLHPVRIESAIVGGGDLPSVFAVSDLAAASMGAAGLAAADFQTFIDDRTRRVEVDRRLASLWFGTSIRPEGWTLPPPWDPLSRDYLAKDGWIRLHTNEASHRSAALKVLGVEPEPGSVKEAVREWPADELESAVHGAGGCAAMMRTLEAWAASEPGAAISSEPLIDWADFGDAAGLTPSGDPARPLKGIRVLDLTRVLAGPVATRFLGLLGADVLRIDPPDWDEPAVVPEVLLGKRTARLDLRQPEGRQRFLDLLRTADVFVHGYRPGALAELGFDDTTLREIRPGLVEVTLDAYGWTGPWRSRRGFDSLVQMSCGLADAGMRTMKRDRPTPLPVQALDQATGYLMAYATCQALTERLVKHRAMRARLSLARTGLLLSRYPGTSATAMEPEGQDDLADPIEQTGWGPARRLKFPVSISGVALSTDRPARPLGSDAPQWF